MRTWWFFELGLVLMGVGFSQIALAEKKSSAAPAMEEQVIEAVSCTQGKEARRLEAQTKEAGCRLFYTKSGKTSEIAQSRNTVDLCLKTLQQVRGNLEKAGYKCK
jgi:hypothetical protein